MKIKKTSSLMILVLLLSSVAIGFLGFAVLTSAQNPVIDQEPIDLGYKVRESHYGLNPNLEPLVMSSAAPKSSASSYYELGDVIWWLYLDDYMGWYDFAQFELRNISTIVEVWVQVDLSYGDDRDVPTNQFPDSDGILRYYYPEVTDKQIAYLVREFENTIYPSDTGVFGEPDFHNGTYATLPGMVGLPPGYYEEETGRNVILVSNIRDEAYYDIDYPYYIGGFYSPSFEYYFDRNIFSMDSNQWYRRMGYEGQQWYSEARGQYDPPVDRPYLYETLLAHEYQHLIHDDYNIMDPLFMNEACSMYAETICGYPWETGDIETFLATPDNSLTDWGDQGGINILADYGAAMLWALYLTDHFTRPGANFLGHFVQAGIPGIEGINAALEYFYYPQDFDDVFHDWRIANLIHSDHPGHGRYNYESVDLGALETQARVYWAKHEERGTDFGNTITDLGYDTGVSMIGSYGTDYIGFDKLKGLNFIVFSGDNEATFLHWEMVDNMWYSGEADLMNTLIAAEVYIDPADPTLYLYTYWDIEDNWDFGFVQVSTDDGNTWTSLENEYTNYTAASSAHPDIVAYLPGLTRWSGYIDPDGWIDMTFDLSAYKGETILIGFRYMTDWAYTYEGWYIGGATVGTNDIMGDLQLLDYVPEVTWMVSIVTKKTYKHRGKTYIKYYIDDMFIFDQCDRGLDFVWVDHRDEVFVLISPIMDFGMADYGFDTYRLKWRWHWR